MPDPQGPTLLDAILEANRLRVGGDASAKALLPPGAMPFVITCMDPRIVGCLIPALGLEGNPPPQAKFAGGVIRTGDQTAMRSILAAAVFNMATEVLVVGHSDCRMGRISGGDVRSALQRLGIRPEAFGGEDPAKWLGAFVSERASVQTSVDALRANPLMPPRMPVHGLLFHLETKGLDVVVRGYSAAEASASVATAPGPVQGAYRSGPASLASPPSPTFGAPGVPLSMPQAARGSVSLGAGGPVPAFGASTAGFSFPAPPPFAAPPPPSPPPMRPPPFAAPPPFVPPAPSPVAPPPPHFVSPPLSSLGETAPLGSAPPPPAPAAPPSPQRPAEPFGKGKGPKKKPGSGGGASPFDRANDVLERLRRDKP